MNSKCGARPSILPADQADRSDDLRYIVRLPSPKLVHFLNSTMSVQSKTDSSKIDEEIKKYLGQDVTVDVDLLRVRELSSSIA